MTTAAIATMAASIDRAVTVISYGVTRPIRPWNGPDGTCRVVVGCAITR